MLAIILGTVLALLIYTIVKRFSYWTDRGVKQGRPLRVFMDEWKNIFRLRASSDMVYEIYNRFRHTRYTGMYQLTRPLLMIKDPELIKQVTTKDFDHFVDHVNVIPETIEPLWNKNLLILQGKKWRDMRSLLSPSFTGSKLKTIFVLIREYAEHVVEHFVEKDQDICRVDVKDLFTRITNDVIATTSFGVNVDSLSEPNNEFYLMGKKLTTFTFRSILMVLTEPFLGGLFKAMNIRFFPKDVTAYFQNLVNESIRMREEKNIERPDMINLMIQAKRESDKQLNGGDSQDSSENAAAKTKSSPKISNEDIVAQVIIFFFGGFDSVSSLMCFAAYELAVNQDIQSRLRAEIQDTLTECGGNVTYDDIMKMKYMDMVISETLRKWPNFVLTDRKCTKDYVIDPITPDEKPVYLKAGAFMAIAVYGIHRDPDYYPDPERFDPERFNDENKGKINPYAYLPFGTGPRSCLGTRFALIETKTVLFYVLLNFEVIPVEGTDIPVKLSKKAFNLQPDGLKLGLKRIKTKRM